MTAYFVFCPRFPSLIPAANPTDFVRLLKYASSYGVRNFGYRCGFSVLILALNIVSDSEVRPVAVL